VNMPSTLPPTTNFATGNNAFSPATSYLIWKCCAWAGPVYLVGSLVSWALIAGFVPPPRADWPVEQLAQFYTDNNLRIRLGMMLTLNFQALWVVWSLAVARVMRQVEGRDGMLSSLYVLCSILNWAIIAFALVFWLTASFRPDFRAAQDIVLLNDLAWVVIDVSVTGTALQYIALATVFLLDKRPQPLIPSWVCWLSYAAAVVILSDTLIPFFASGPFSWHGMISFWMEYPMYFLWIVPVSYHVIKAINRLEQEACVI